jgi:phage repressor protein C with HTH and peptisase S24 domain
MSIQARIKQIRTDSGQTQEQFAKSIGLKRDNYAQIEIGKQLPSYETISAIVRVYNKSYSWIIEGKEGKVFSQESAKGDSKDRGKVTGKVTGKVAEPNELDSYTKNLTPTIIDTDGIKLVPIVDIKAAAGTGYLNTETLEAEDVIHLPATLLKSGHHLCIRIKGTSMSPTFQDGGYLIIRLLELDEWVNMLNERCYVIVDKDGKTYVKRVKNRFSGGDKGFIVLSSDSPDKASHPTFNLHPQEIAHIWYVEWYFTAKMPNIHDQYYSRVSNLEDKVDLLAEELAGVKKQLK